jgi:hypothetical protein
MVRAEGFVQMSQEPDPARRRSATLGQTAKAVLWSFFGVRKQSSYEKDARDLNPVHVIIMAILAAAAFIAILIGIIKYIVLP